MNDVPDNELLSAYLDGELTAAEQAQVEELLAASPAARQLLDELRALSGTVQSLPQHKLDEDLSGRVLRMAERQVLTESDQPRTAAPLPAPTPHRPIIRRMLTPRALVWSGLAVAAALLIMVTEQHLRDQRQGREVATTGALKDDAARPPSISARPPTAEESAPEEPPALDMEPDLAGVPGEEVVPAEVTREHLAEKGAADSAARDLRYEPKKAPVDGGAPKRAVAGKLRSAPGDVEEAGPPNLPASPVAPGKGGRLIAKDDAEPDSTAVGRAKAGRFAGRPDDMAGEAAAEGDGLAHGGTIAGGLVLVDISPEAARQRTFERLLLAKGIDWQETEVQGEDRGEEQAVTDLQSRKPRQEQLRERAEEERSYGPYAGAHDIQLVCVEATPSQVEATLADLARRGENSSDILSLSVSPAPRVQVQRDWGQYSRSAGQLARARRAGQTDLERLQTLVEEESVPADAFAPSERQAKGKEGLQRGRAWTFEDVGQWSYDQARPPAAHYLYGAIPPRGAAAAQRSPAAPQEPTPQAPPPRISQPAPTAEQAAEPQPPEQQAQTPPPPADQPAPQQQLDAARRQTLQRGENIVDTLDVAEGREPQRAQTFRVLFVLRVVGPDLPTAASTTDEPAPPAADSAPAKQ